MFNVVKSPAPQGDFLYNDVIVVELIRQDFFDKCYLCEEKTPRHLEVEHFYPLSYFPHLKNDWNYLLCICNKCNKIRPKNINTTDENEVLDCCTTDVENLILLKFNNSDSSISFTGANGNIIITNTIKLLQRIHNGIDTASNSYIDLRKLIAQELAELEDEINSF